MKKNLGITLLLAAVLILLTACSSQQGQSQQYEVVSVQPQVTQVSSQAGTVVSDVVSGPAQYDFDNGDYDPASEEGVMDTLEDVDEPVWTPYEETVYTAPTPAPTMNSVYAGATPVVIDPIDKPTPTPAPPITFTEFATYDATKLGVAFNAPTGWVVNDDANDTYTLTNPDSRMDYHATLTVYVYTLNSDYSQSDLTKEVRSILSSNKALFNSYSPSNTATRTLLDKNGVYADFTGTLKSTGQEVGGRIHAVSLNKKLYILQMMWPKAYQEVYKDTVYKQFRHTFRITK